MAVQMLQLVVLCCVALAVIDPVAAAGFSRGRSPGQFGGNAGNSNQFGGNVGNSNGGLQQNFYQQTCPNAESIVFSSMQSSYSFDKSIAPGVLRMSFHDCFVRGCDGSVLLDGLGTERKSFANNFRQSTFDAVDRAKRAVEQVCPGIVSCADVLQFAARDAVILTGGQGWPVPGGRRDGTISLTADANANLPGPTSTAPQLIARFQNKGLSIDQMVTLSGAHTIGTAGCVTFDNRLWGKPRDPTLPLKLVGQLLQQCPKPGLLNRVGFDATPGRFDTQYFVGVATGTGLLTSDVTLAQDPRCRRSVLANALPFVFNRNFADAMVALSRIGVLTGRQGEIRRQTYTVNGSP